MELVQERNRVDTLHGILNNEHRLEYIRSTDNTSYYKIDNIIVKIYDWGELYPINLVREEFMLSIKEELDANNIMERYLKETKLPILQLCILNRNSKIVPMLINLWEYKVIVKGETNVNPELKRAYIKTSHYPLIILVENSEKDMVIIEDTLNKMEEELLKLTNKTFMEIETYG